MYQVQGTMQEIRGTRYGIENIECRTSNAECWIETSNYPNAILRTCLPAAGRVQHTWYLILMPKSYPIQKSEQEWQDQLDPLSYQVLRQKGTERPFTGAYTLNKETGIYSCKGCGNPIFHSDFKYDSGCGWPSFTQPIRPEAIEVKMDYSHLMIREEILCASCGGHLGHRFPDGPSDQGGIRYCINSVSMEFGK